MSVKIHHGPHGSYKTAGAIHDDLIPAIRAGRPIVTNVRGITLEKIFEAIPETPENIELYHVDTATSEGMEKMARFFHWVPNNAFILVDEAQLVFPKKWRQSDIDALNYPGGFDAAIAAGRAPDWDHAWDMERHHNFDIVLTTPNIKKIRDDIRGNAEGAFKHKNLGLYGRLFRGSYVEGFHMADDNGTATSDFQTVVKKRIGKNDVTWKLYQSTATGDHRDTTAGISLLASPRILVPLGVLALALFFVTRNGVPDVINPEKSAPVHTPAPVQTPPVSVRQGFQPAVHHAGVDVAPESSSSPDRVEEKRHPFDGSQFRLLGIIEKRGQKHAYFDVDGVFMSSDELIKLQYTLDYMTDCAVVLHHRYTYFMVTCQAVPETTEAVAEGGTGKAQATLPLNVANIDPATAAPVVPSDLPPSSPTP